MDIMFVLYIVWMVVGLAIGLMLGLFIFSPMRRVLMMKRLSKKEYGIVNFIGAGKSIFTTVKNFEADVIRHKGRVWLLVKSKVYRVVNEEEVCAEGQETKEITLPVPQYDKLGRQTGELTKTFKVIEPNELSVRHFQYKSGVPAIFLSMDDMIPMTLEHEPISGEISRSPVDVANYLSTEVEAEKAMVAANAGKSPNLLLLLVMIIAAIGVFLSFMAFSNSGATLEAIQQLNATLAPSLNAGTIIPA